MAFAVAALGIDGMDFHLKLVTGQMHDILEDIFTLDPKNNSIAPLIFSGISHVE